MNYEKLTPEKFKVNLKAGKYQHVAGARRAVGKADWTDEAREKCRALIDAQFGASATVKGPKTPKAVKSGATKEKVAKKTEAPAKKPGKRGRPPKAKKVAAEAAEADPGVQQSIAVIGSLSHALKTLTEAKTACPVLDISEAQAVIDRILKEILQLTSNTMGLTEDTVTVTSNGVSVSYPSNGSSEHSIELS